MTEPLFRTFKRNLKTVLERVKDNTSSLEIKPALFRNVYFEHPLARDLAAQKLPAATIWGDDSALSGSPERSFRTVVETSIYVYFHEADYSKADEKMDYFKRDIVAQIHGNQNQWPVLCAVQVTGTSNTDLFRRLGLPDITIDPPYYGLRFDLTVDMGTAYT